ncbi:MAG: LemA family protein [Bacilli bacterium]|nr:LemA family protein [Bacilli bacterium]
MIIEYVYLIIIVICILTMCFAAIYNKFQINIIRINEAEANIDSTLRKRFDLLNKAINVIKHNTEEKVVLDSIKKLRSRKLNNFDLDRELVAGLNEFYGYTEKYPDLKTNEQYMNINFGLAETESEIVAFRKYYNDIITDYNKMVKTFPTNIVALFSKYKVKPYFDRKDNDIEEDVKL